jgi:nicotinamidase-related amidase
VSARPWDDLIGAEDRAIVERARFGRRVGFGDRAALLVIDAQNYMVGPPLPSLVSYPSACGPVAVAALGRLAPLLEAARTASAPVIYTRFELRRDGTDMGVYARKRDLLETEGWCLEGSIGAQIAPAVAPREGDIVFVKKKPSAFHGTPLLDLLVDRRIDTVLVTGGSTSNCVRATAVDAASYNFRTIVVEDCVFDRIDVSHRIALFDLDRQYADVLDSDALIKHLRAADPKER